MGNPFFVTVLTVVWVGQANSEGNRRYSKLSDEEADYIINGVIEKKEPRIQGPHMSNYSRSLPNGRLVSRGVRIDDKDFVVWAAAQAKDMNLIEFNRFYLLERGASNIPEEMERIPFLFNGIFVTSVDLETLGNPHQTIKKGGYEWWVGPYGIWLINEFIFFQKPIENFSLSAPITIHVIDFLLPTEAGAGFAVGIKDKVIQFK